MLELDFVASSGADDEYAVWATLVFSMPRTETLTAVHEIVVAIPVQDNNWFISTGRHLVGTLVGVQ